MAFIDTIPAAEAGVTFTRSADLNPYQFLPQWVHPRKSA